MNAKRKTRNTNRAWSKAATALILCMAFIFAAQGQGVTAITGVELSSGPRGLILTLSGTGPITLGAMPADLETTTTRYPELHVNISNIRSGMGSAAILPPEQLPVREISLAETAEGVALSVKMRGAVNGPVDVRSGVNQVRILLTRDPQPEMIWSPPPAPPAARPAPPAPAAIKAAPLPPAAQTGAPAAGAIKTEPLDMKKAEERAVKDVHASGGEMFTVKDGPKTAAQPKQTPPLQTSQTPPPPPQMPPPLPPPQTPAQSMPAAHAVPPAQAAPTIAPKAETAVVEENAPPEPEPPRGAGLVRYRTRGRDPFVPLVKDTVSTDLPRVENLRLVGILEDYNEKIALVEDFKNDNRAFALRANDEVEHGKVLRVQRDRVVFLIRDFDISRSYVLTLSAP